MSTLFLGEPPTVIDDWLSERRRLGHDRCDEMWEGNYHVVPGPAAEHSEVDSDLGWLVRGAARAAGLKPTTAFNLGEKDDYRVPDGGVHRERPSGVYVATAALVVEILSPGDETFAKFGFYAARGVEEVVVADPAARTVRVWRRTEMGEAPDYEETGRSHVLDVTASTLTDAVDWP